MASANDSPRSLYLESTSSRRNFTPPRRPARSTELWAWPEREKIYLQKNVIRLYIGQSCRLEQSKLLLRILFDGIITNNNHFNGEQIGNKKGQRKKIGEETPLVTERIAIPCRGTGYYSLFYSQLMDGGWIASWRIGKSRNAFTRGFSLFDVPSWRRGNRSAERLKGVEVGGEGWQGWNNSSGYYALPWWQSAGWWSGPNPRLVIHPHPPSCSSRAFVKC